MRAKADRLEGELRDMRGLENQRWDVQDVAQRNLHTSIQKMALDQQQFQVGRPSSCAPARCGVRSAPALVRALLHCCTAALLHCCTAALLVLTERGALPRRDDRRPR